MRLSSIFLFFVFNTGLLFAQANKTFTLFFHPLFGSSSLHLNDEYYKLNKTDSVQIETFRFYISGIELLSKDQVAWKEKNSFHLIDASESKSLRILIDLPLSVSFDQVRFNLGIDSTTNVSGAMGGDLDPTLGMYWTWQSGYINLKLEGKSNLCKTRNNEFQFHLGGYQYPFNCLQTVVFKTEQKDKADIDLDLGNFLDGIDLFKQNHIMSPSAEAVSLSGKVLKIFRAHQE